MGLLSSQRPGQVPQTSNTHPSGSPLWQLQTQPCIPATPPSNNMIPYTPLPPVQAALTPIPATPAIEPTTIAPSRRRPLARIIVIALIGILAYALYVVWHTSPTSPATTTSTTTTGSTGVTQQNFRANTTTNTNTTSTNTGDMQVYIVGAVKHPGVYKLAPGSRVYELLQAAGGPLPQANLVALNLVAKLQDGQEVYVATIGDTPSIAQTGLGPTSQGTATNTAGAGQCIININTASSIELQTTLHISSKTAKAIFNHRLQQGEYTRVEELLTVVSKTTYNKIKDKVCVS